MAQSLLSSDITILPQKVVCTSTIYNAIHNNRYSDIQGATPSKHSVVDTEMCQSAIMYERLDIIIWLKPYAPKTFNFCAYAAKLCKLNVLKHLYQNGNSLNTWVCYYAALNGNFEILEWAREHGCDWNYWVCYFAAKNGNLHILKWARENGCEWNKSICAVATRSGQFNVLQWAINNGCNYDIISLLNIANTLKLTTTDINEMVSWLNELKVEDIKLQQELKVKDDQLQQELKVKDDIKLQQELKVKDDQLQQELKAKDDQLQQKLKAKDDIKHISEQSVEPVISTIFNIKEYENIGLINAVDSRKKAIKQIIANIGVVIANRLTQGSYDYQLGNGQLKYCDEIKFALEHYSYIASLIHDENNKTLIHIEW